MSRSPAPGDPASPHGSGQRGGRGGEPASPSSPGRGTATAIVLTVVLAIGLALSMAAPAMAADGVEVPTVDPNAADAGSTESHEIGFGATGLNDTGTVTVELPAAFGNDGSGDVGSVGGEDVVVEGGDLDGDPTVDDGTVAFDVDVAGDSVDIDVTLSLDLTHPDAAGDHDVTATVESADGSAATGTGTFSTSAAPEYLVDGTPRSTVFQGQTVTVAGLEPDGSYTLRRGDGGDSDPVTVEAADGDGTVAVETAELDVDADYFLADGDGDIDAGEGFELVEHELDATFGDGTVADAGDGSTTTFSVGSALRTETYPVEVSAGGSLDSEELFRVLTGGESADGVPRDADPEDLDDATTTVGPSGFAVALYDPDVDGADERIVLIDGGENDGAVSFEGITTTTYDLDVRSLETDATDTATVDVEEADLDGSFGQNIYTTPAGDLVEISANLGEADGGYVVIGGDRLSDPDVPAGYLDVLYVEGNPSITANTRLIGTDAPTEDVYASDGVVVSYAHEYGPDTNAADTGTFSELRFEDDDGTAVADDLAGFRGAAATGGIAGPLIPQRYRLTVGTGDAIVVRDDGVVEPERALARSHLVLTEPAFREGIEVHTATSGSASEAGSIDELLEDGLERTNVTEGDRIVLGFEASGIWGAMTHFAGEEAVYEDGESSVAPLEDLLTVDEGISLTVRQTNPGRNERRTELDLSAASTGEAYLLFGDPEGTEGLGDGPTAGAFHLVIDTRGSAFTEAVAPGDEFAVEFAIEGDEDERYRFDRSGSNPPNPFAAESASDDGLNQQFPYLGYEEAGVNATASFRIVEERLEYDRTTVDGDLLVAPDDGVISGTTTLLPATDLEAEIVSDAGPTPTIANDEVEVTDDGSFSIDADFSASEPGHRVNVELYRSGSLYDSRAILVVSDPENPFSFAIDDAAERVTVAEGAPLENVSATVRNEGDIRGVDRLELDVDDGRLVDDERVRAWPDDAENVSFSRTVADLPPGEYPFTLAIDGDETDGTLIVEPSPDAGAGEEGDADRDVDGNVDGEAGADGEGAEGDGSGGDGSNEGDEADVGGEGDGDDVGDAGEDAPGGEDDEPSAAVPLPFGVGTREAFGGTAVVGATYLLAHWV